MRLTTWNVNGIRNPFAYQPWNTARTFPAMFDILGSDIVVMQELKIQRKDLRDDMVLIDGWDCYFSLPKHKKGYSGVGIYTRNATCSPIKAEEGLLGVLPSPSGVSFRDLPVGDSIGGYPSVFQVAELGVDPDLLDAEGRCVVLEFPAFVLFGVYSPANSNGMRDDFRYGFITALDCRIRNLVRQGKRVVLVGDLNVSRDELDSAGAVEDCRKEGLTHEDYISTPNRRIFNQLLIGGEVVGARDEGREEGVLWDTTRGFHPGRTGMYTHWEQKINARPGNYGGRIDFVLVAESMQTWVKDANIQEGLLGSDHCPVFADFHDTIRVDDHEVTTIDIMNPQGVFESGVRQIEWKIQDAPAFSAKKLPEFDKRRSIKSMFAAPSIKKSQPSSMAPPTSEDNKPVSSAGGTPEPTVMDKGLEATRSTLASPVKSQQPRASPATKRKGSASAKDTSTKRSKPENGTSASKGQQSLKGFFRAQDKDPAAASRSNEAKKNNEANEKNGGLAQLEKIDDLQRTLIPPSPKMSLDAESQSNTQSIPGDGNPTESQSPIPDTADSPSPSEISAQFEAVEQNQRTWGALFAKPAAPLCEGHNEPCKTMLTKKKGSNQGRSFWMCARPLGPSGNKERGTQWRCPTFVWCSDWTGRKDGTAGTT